MDDVACSNDHAIKFKATKVHCAYDEFDFGPHKLQHSSFKQQLQFIIILLLLINFKYIITLIIKTKIIFLRLN